MSGEEPVKEDEIRNRQAFARYLDLVREDVERSFADRSGFTLVACPGCGGDRVEEAFVKIGFRYVVCRDCGTLFVNPRPSADLLAEFYTDAPSSRFWVEGFFLPVAEARREKIFKPRADDVASRFSSLSAGAVADIGAGFGLFLEELRKHWPAAKLTAVEPSPEMAAICRSKGFDTTQTTIERWAGDDGGYDLVTVFELLEHLHDPFVLLAHAHRLLRRGGRLLATTLNGEGFDILVLWDCSKSVFPPHHLNFLNPRALGRLCERAGFVVEEVTTPGRLDWDIVEGSILQEGTDAGRWWSCLARTGREDAKRDLQQWIATHGWSSHMRVVARKP